MILIDFINDIQIFGGKITSPYSEITWPYFAITRPYSEITHPYSKICNFAATLLPPIFPFNRAFNAIWWQGGSKI